MKKVFFSLLCISVTTVSAIAQDSKAPVAHPTAAPASMPAATAAPAKPAVDPDAGIFKFKEETHDYGEVPEGPLAETDFEFKNVGKKPISITEAHGSCGCTVPKWPSEPILPGKKGIIHVAYSTQNRQGMISKEVTINSNAQQSPMVLHIRGTVKPKPVEATPPSTVTPAANK